MCLNTSDRIQIQALPLPIAPEPPPAQCDQDDEGINGQRIIHIRARDRQSSGEWQPDRQVYRPTQGEDVDRGREAGPQAPPAILHGAGGRGAQTSREACVQDARNGDDVGCVQAQGREGGEGAEGRAGGGPDFEEGKEHHDDDG